MLFQQDLESPGGAPGSAAHLAPRQTLRPATGHRSRSGNGHASRRQDRAKAHPGQAAVGWESWGMEALQHRLLMGLTCYNITSTCAAQKGKRDTHALYHIFPVGQCGARHRRGARVVTDISAVHSLVAQVMGDLGEPVLCWIRAPMPTPSRCARRRRVSFRPPIWWSGSGRK